MPKCEGASKKEERFAVGGLGRSAGSTVDNLITWVDMHSLSQSH